MTIYATREQTMQAIRGLTEKEMTMLLRGAARKMQGTEYTEPSDLLSEAIARLMRPAASAEEALDPGAPEFESESESESESMSKSKSKSNDDDDGDGDVGDGDGGAAPEGKPRRWPLHVGFGPCLQLIMLSIATNSRKRKRNTPGIHIDIDPEVGSDGQAEAQLAPPRDERLQSPSAEREAAARQLGRMAMLAASRARDSLIGDRDAQRVIDGMVAGLDPAEACVEFGIMPALYEPARKRAVRALRRRAVPMFGLALGRADPLESEELDA